MPEGVGFPYLLLLVSGGHCQCVAVEGVGRHVRLGTTLDDAAGEAFDKVAKLLGLGWPGGPALERLAAGGDAGRFGFPRPLLGRAGCDFSFSGLKTAVAQEVVRHGAGALPVGLAADVAASFQRAVAEVLADRASNAMAMMRERAAAARLLVVAGGGGGEWGGAGSVGGGRPGARVRAGGAAGAALHGQRRDGGVGGDRAAPTWADGWAGFCASAALAAGSGDGANAGSWLARRMSEGFSALRGPRVSDADHARPVAINISICIASRPS